MKFEVATCLLLASCTVVNPMTPMHSAVAPAMKAQVDATSAAMEHLLARTDMPLMTDPDVVALAAPADGAPAITQSTRADWGPFAEASEKWDPLLASLHTRQRADASTELAVTIDCVAWMRAFVIAGRRINASELGSANENAHHEHGLLTVENAMASALVSLMITECTGNPGAAEASTLDYLTAPPTYAPLRASVLATIEKSTEQLIADPKNASCADKLHAIGTVVEQARDHAVAP